MGLNRVAGNLSSESPSNNNFPSAGQRLTVHILEKDGENIAFKIKNNIYTAKLSGEGPASGHAKLEVIKTAPHLEVKVISPENTGKFPAGSIRLEGTGILRTDSTVHITVIKTENGIAVLRIGSDEFTARLGENVYRSQFTARVVSANPPVVIPRDDVLTDRPDLKSVFMQVALKSPQTLAADMGAARLGGITAAELREIIRNSGLFFEAKLGKNEPVESDNKYRALTDNNLKQWDGITRMQLAAVFLEEGVFSFFELEDTDEPAVIRISRETYGTALYLKMSFTRLGQTVISAVPTYSGIYNVSIKTREDISGFLENLSIKGANISWSKLKLKDQEDFNMAAKVVLNLGRFNIIV